MKLAVEGLQYPEAARLSTVFCSWTIVLLAIAHCISRIFSRTLFLNAARIIEFRIREDLFSKLLLLDQLFFSGSRTGDILSRFSNDLTNVRMLAGFGAMSAVNAIIIYVATITMMLRIHPWLTLYSIIPFPLMLLVVKKVSNNLFQRSIESQEELSRLSSLAEESVSAVRLIKSYCREEHFQKLFKGVSDDYLRCNLGLARLRGLLIPVMAAATGMGTLIVLFVGGRLVISAAITLGDFVAFSGYLAMLVWPTAMLGWILTLAQRGSASMSRLSVILDNRPSITDKPDAEKLEGIHIGIELRNLSFAYKGINVLNGISCSIAAGDRVGITGEVGSGKTTLLKLIQRLLPIADGQILIDGRDINGVTLESLRSVIGYVPQEAFLFSRSIRENVGYGSAVDNDGVYDLVRRAGLTEDVERFHEGVETLVGEKGVALSGGQKQRLSLARALSVEPDILLLDDPLSAVDAGREEEILDEVNRFCNGRTVLIVSHRLSAFRDCGRIMVLHNGIIAEEGSHNELLAQNGLYAGLHRRQCLQEELL